MRRKKLIGTTGTTGTGTCHLPSKRFTVSKLHQNRQGRQEGQHQ